VGLFGPIIGIALSFDSINREVASGSMLKMLSNPIRRDNIITGKIVAGLLIILLLISCATSLVVGFAMLMAGFGPGVDGAFRIIYFVFASFLYVGLWFGAGLLVLDNLQEDDDLCAGLHLAMDLLYDLRLLSCGHHSDGGLGAKILLPKPAALRVSAIPRD